MKKGFFSVSIEGGDSTGKGTQTALLASHLKRRGLKVRALEVPLKSLFTHRLIYFMLRHGLASKLPRVFHFVQFVNKFWWQVFTLPLWICRYDAVIFDRWHGSYWVYGKETGLDPDGKLMRLYSALYRPDCTVVLSGTRHVNEVRDEYEKNASLQERVRERYNEWASENKDLVSVVCANQDTLDVHHDIVGVLCDRGLVDPNNLSWLLVTGEN